jgi:uncharacterized repeat protein (TIGR03803 family)
MRYNTPTFLALFFSAIFGFLVAPSAAFATQEQVLYSFCSLSACTDGQYPGAGLLMDKVGNFYGTTWYGGLHNAGVVYELSRTSSGWQETVLHSFGGTPDGYGPQATLLMDESGNLYGTTLSGGAFDEGTVFELMRKPTSSGWTEKILHSFDRNGLDGSFPNAGLVRDAYGNLYGSTYYGGPLSGCNGFGCGTVYELSSNSNGVWGEEVIFAFNPDGLLGAEPADSLTLDQQGNLYGTTSNGGPGGTPYGIGVVFELVSNGNNGWAEKVLYNFGSKMYDGNNPLTNVIFDAAGNLYGTTGDGAYTTGSVFELTPQSSGQWTFTQLCSFCYSPSPLSFDHAGNLYTTINQGGTYNYGYVLELVRPTAGGKWQQTMLNNFDLADGSGPTGNLILDGSSDSIYGVTSYGGANLGGTVYEITP